MVDDEKVVVMPGLVRVDLSSEADEELVERLEELLAAARAGQITAIAYVALDRDSSTRINWLGHGDTMLMICGLSRLQYRYLKEDEERNG